MGASSSTPEHKVPSKMQGIMAKIQLDKHMKLDEAKAIWDEFDTDKSGTLESKEVAKFVAKFCEVKGIEASEAAALGDAFLAAFDVDSDGSLSFDELTGKSAMKFVAQKNEPDAKVDNYKTYDNDMSFGKAFPSLESVQWGFQGEAPDRKNTTRPMVVLMWAKFNKGGYRFMPKYSALHACFKNHVDFVGLSIDPKQEYVEGFMKKYAPQFPTSFPIAWDVKQDVKPALESIARNTLSTPTCFIVDAAGNIVWRQDHSAIGATVADYMDQVERQLGLLLQGDALESNGPKPKGEEDDEEEEDDEDDDDGDFDPLA